MGSAAQPLHSAIIGAGIGGLCAAIALRRAGHDVTVFEKSSFKNELGAAITMTPNANRILDNWGFDAAKAAETLKCQTRLLDCNTLDQLSQHDLTDVREKYGHAFNAFHRVDIHTQLRDMATELGANIELSHAATNIDCATARVDFSSGKSWSGDLLIVADGLKSIFTKAISGAEEPVRKMGKSVFRTLIPMEDIMKDPLTRSIFENQSSGFCSGISNDGVFFITYPCRRDTVLNVAVFHPTRPGHEDDEGWNSPATSAEVLSVLEGQHPAWSAIAKKTNEWICLPIVMREPIPRFNNGRAIIIGDAAHPFQPTHAQGGCMAIEDAAALEILFSHFDNERDSVEHVLAIWNQLRLPRANTTQLYSNIMFYHPMGTEPSEDFTERIRRYYSGELMPFKVRAWGQEHQAFWYPYDAFEQAKKALEYKDRPEGIPDGVIKHFY